MGSESHPSEALDSDQRRVLREFLAQAPPELHLWARNQERLIDEPTESPGSGETDESDDFYNDMEGEDDILQRKRKTGLLASGSPSPVKQNPIGFTAGAKVALALALVLGAGFGVWYAGRAPVEQPVASTPMMSADSAAANDPMRQAELEQILSTDPSDVDARLELGVLYFNQARVAEAEEQWLEVTQLDPQNLEAWYNLGFVYLSASPADMEGARNAWERVVEIAPDSDLAKTVQMHLEGVETPSPETTGSDTPSPETYGPETPGPESDGDG